MAGHEINRDETLANFQSCTGIDDVEEAIMWLEEANWDLLAAIEKAVPQESQNIQGNYTSSSSKRLQNGIPVSISSDFCGLPSTSNNTEEPAHFIEIYVHYLNKPIKLKVPDQINYDALKMIIYSETGVPTCSQVITGWEIEPTSENTPLARLNCTHRTNLFLLSPVGVGEKHSSTKDSPYHLKINDKINNKEYNLRLPGCTTVGDVMKKAFILTNIPVNCQVWQGWPDGVNDGKCISLLGLTRPVHNLSLHSSNEHPNTPPTTQMFIDLAGSDSSVEDFEDASEFLTGDDEIFVEETSVSRRSEPLIPDNVEDETAGSVHFIDGFTRRYGQNVPNFLPGSLEEAIREASMRRARERRMLAIYLHHDRSVLSNVFCTELLGNETVLQTFGNYFVLWGWDLTNEANKNMCLASVMKNLGSHVADTIRNMSTEILPALMILTKTRANTELFNVIYGNIGLNDFLGLLIHAVDVFSDMQANEIKEENEREARERIKTEQDHAYQQSLLMDRAKEEAKKKQQELDSEEQQRKLDEQKAEEQRRCAERTAVLAQIPDEPSEGAPDVIKIKFRAPTGNIFERRFSSNDILQTIFNVLLVNGFRISEYKVISGWPRRDISSCDASASLKHLNFHPQETLILEER